MGGGAGQELCFHTGPQLLYDTILSWFLEWDSTAVGDRGGISIPCTPRFPYVILMLNAKKMYFQIR